MSEYPYDVFISYAKADLEWVQDPLVKTLEARRFKTYVDYRDFVPGMPKVQAVAEVREQCRCMVLVMTPAYLQSAWAEFDLRMWQTLDPVNRDVRVIPLLKDPCSLPPDLQALVHLDFVDPPGGLAMEWERLFKVLMRHLPQDPNPSAGATDPAAQLERPPAPTGSSPSAKTQGKLADKIGVYVQEGTVHITRFYNE